MKSLHSLSESRIRKAKSSEQRCDARLRREYSCDRPKQHVGEHAIIVTRYPFGGSSVYTEEIIIQTWGQ